MIRYYVSTTLTLPPPPSAIKKPQQQHVTTRKLALHTRTSSLTTGMRFVAIPHVGRVAGLEGNNDGMTIEAASAGNDATIERTKLGYIYGYPDDYDPYDPIDTEAEEKGRLLVIFDRNHPNIQRLSLRKELIDKYIETLTLVLGSEEEARKKIYCAYTRHLLGFKCNLEERYVRALEGLPDVKGILESYTFCMGKNDWGAVYFDHDVHIDLSKQYYIDDQITRFSD